MGVPSFYRWLVGKYPNVVVPAREEDDDGGDDGGTAAAAAGGGGPNGVYHNLYLDMNGIIHPCFHPEDQVCAPTTFDEVFEAMFEYMDRLVRIVRPTKLLYLAVDGVAPRAKMNQQRSRRFKAAKDAKDAVILSDSTVPGEGEHKIMSFIRAQRSRESYDPNTRHCLYGLDADLIMLALASHEIHFSILREDVLRQVQPENCIHLSKESIKTEESSRKCRGWFPRLTEASPRGKIPKTPYQFLNIWILREYLELDLMIPNPVIKMDIERLIDDFIFICFLTGNDFIPHIPSLEIHENAVDLLIEVYKTTFNKMGGYIVNTEKVKDKHAAYLKISRLEKFFNELSLFEEKIFVKRYELRERLQRNILRQAAEKEWAERNFDYVEENHDGPDLTIKSFSTQCSISTSSSDKSDIAANTLELRQNLKDILRNKQDLVKSGACKHDSIKLGLAGWKSRFYREKFGIESCNEVGKLKKDMVQKYLEGLCWVLQYYFADMPSWSWYYPFYYAPFASDLKGLSQFKISFTVDKPLKAFDQLMAVLPPESSCALPKCYRELMDGEGSSIQKFYPSDLQIDTHGKRFLWQGIAKLPFIDEKLLLSATKTVENDLAIHEMNRNTVRQEKIFMTNSNTLANHAAAAQLTKLAIDPATSELGGWLSPTDDDGMSSSFFRSPIKDLEDIRNDQTTSFMFFNPEPVKPNPRLLDHVKIPEKTLTEDDILRRPLWHTYPGTRPPATIATTAETQPRSSGFGLGRGDSSFGRGRGGADANAEMRQRTSSHGRGFHGAEMLRQGQGGGFDSVGVYSFQPGGAWTGQGGPHEQYGGTFQRQQASWRPVGPWARGGGGGGNGGGRGGSGQPQAW